MNRKMTFFARGLKCGGFGASGFFGSSPCSSSGERRRADPTRTMAEESAPGLNGEKSGR